MANVRKLEMVKDELAATRKAAAARTRGETKARVVDGAIEIASAIPGGAAAAALDHYQGEAGEVHKIGPVPTNALVGLGLGVAGVLIPKKARMVGAGIKGLGAGMLGYAAGRYTADMLEEREE